MPSSLLDVCRFFPTAGGTTDWTVSSAVPGYQTPASAGAVNATQYSYRAESADLSQWEVGIGNYTAAGTVQARTTVLFNSLGTTAKINFTGIPQVALVALTEDLAKLINATLQASPTNPAATASTGGVMMGLGTTCKLTPVYSTRVLIFFMGQVANTVAGNGSVMGAKFGTGTAPANAGAVVGTAIGTNTTVAAPAAGASSFFGGLGGIVTGLTPGTAYWFDLFLAVTAGTSTITNVGFTAMEF